MAGVLFYNPLARQLSISGTILPGWTAQFYLTGTTTPADVYTDGALTTPHTNPVEADADGHMPPIYLNPAVTYRVLMKDADGVTVPDGDIDPIDVSRGSGGSGSAPPIAHGRVNAGGTLQAGSANIASVTRPSTGQYLITFTASYFSSVPTCVGSIATGDHNGVGLSISDDASSSSVTVFTHLIDFPGQTLASTNSAFTIIAIGTS